MKPDTMYTFFDQGGLEGAQLVPARIQKLFQGTLQRTI